jgi:type IV pilus assembly protein PilF
MINGFFRSRSAESIAICFTFALLCASCATGARQGNEKKTPKELAQVYTQVGTQALMRAEYPQAVEDLRKAIALDSENAIAHNHLGLAYYALGRKDLAKKELNSALDADPQYSDALINLGNFAVDENNLSAARKYYNKALDNLEYKPRHRALTSLAELSLRENKTDEARRLLYQSLQANPDYCLSHFLMGSIYMKDGTPARAATEFKKSIVSTCASNVEGQYQLGLAYVKTKDFDKARKTFASLVEQYPQTLQAQKAGDMIKEIP